MKKIGIVGKDSFIGKVLFDFLAKSGKYYVTGTTIDTLDITNSDAIAGFVKNERCDAIILLAGSKNVKELEANPDFGYKINVKPVEDFVRNITKERFIYFSSDYVFGGKGGKKGNYSIFDEVCPNTVYGKNKASTEEIIQKSGINYSIVRTAAVLGKESVFLSWLVKTLGNENFVEMFEDSYFTPTCVTFLCEAVEKIIEHDKNQIYHAVQEKRLSRYELSCMVKSILKSNCRIIPVKNKFEDRSLIQCDFVKGITTKTFEKYLRDELCIK